MNRTAVVGGVTLVVALGGFAVLSAIGVPLPNAISGVVGALLPPLLIYAVVSHRADAAA